MERDERKMEENQRKKTAAATPKIMNERYINGARIGLRILALMTCLISASIMFTAEETTFIYGISMNAKYSYSPAFKFCAVANVIAGASALLSVICEVIFFFRRGSTDHIVYYLFLHDLVVMSVLLAGSAAAMAIGYLGKHGNQHAGWLSICEHFTLFCSRITIAVVFSFFSFITFLILTIISATKSSMQNQAVDF